MLNWDDIKTDYYSFMNRDALCKKYKITTHTITNAIKSGILEKRVITSTHSDDTKNKISKKRKDYLLNNPDEHPWRKNSKFISKPCEELKVFLRNNNIEFVEEFRCLDNYNYSIDIAFPDKKLGLEINGNQHYDRDGKLKDYYLKRQELINNDNWHLIQIHYPLCYNTDYRNELIDIILNRKQILEFSYNTYVPVIKEKEENKRLKNKIIYEQKQKEYVTEILNSNIDFAKYGWVNDVSLVINQKQQKVNKWMKRFMSDFYDSKCFHRNKMHE